jgi:hypothetical protein
MEKGIIEVVEKRGRPPKLVHIGRHPTRAAAVLLRGIGSELVREAHAALIRWGASKAEADGSIERLFCDTHCESPIQASGDLWFEALHAIIAAAPPKPIRLPKMKPDDQGRLRRMPASFIMRRDEYAKAAYKALRRRGLGRTAAETEIERCFEASFRTVLFSYRDPDRCDPRPECWLLLSQGLSLTQIFDLRELGMGARLNVVN